MAGLCRGLGAGASQATARGAYRWAPVRNRGLRSKPRTAGEGRAPAAGNGTCAALGRRSWAKKGLDPAWEARSPVFGRDGRRYGRVTSGPRSEYSEGVLQDSYSVGTVPDEASPSSTAVRGRTASAAASAGDRGRRPWGSAPSRCRWRPGSGRVTRSTMPGAHTRANPEKRPGLRFTASPRNARSRWLPTMAPGFSLPTHLFLHEG